MLKVQRLLALIMAIGVSLALGSQVYAAPAQADARWTAKYWNNTSLSGTPVVERQEESINYNWGTGRPVDSVNRDRFSARWRRTVNFSAGTYRFTVTSDDGVRLWIDDRIILDRWYDHPAETYTVDVNLSAGEHGIKMEYYENIGEAVAKLSWSRIDASPGAWEGRYFSNRSLSGNPVLVRQDSAIDFDWGTGKPASGVGLPSDGFSARWTRMVNFPAGTYRFTLTSDDGVRLWIDDRITIDRWYDHAAETYTADVNLTAGDHLIRVEYYENTGQALIKLSWAAAGAAINNWRGEYFNNTNLSGTAIMVRDDGSITFDWGTGGPGGGVNADLFSVRWTRTVNFPAGTYRFTVTSDDGVRLWIDDRITIDRWYDHAAETYTADVNLTAGDHRIRMEYYENGGQAVAKLAWSAGGAPAANWRGEYFNNIALSGTPVLVRDDGAIDFDWGTGGPGGGVNADLFSVRWTRTVNFSAGTYRFTATSDDGIRVWVDDRLIIDRWYDHGAETYTADVALFAGDHRLKVEHYENGGLAVAKLSWGAVPAQPPPTAGLSATVTAGALNIRSGPGIGYPVIGLAYRGHSVTVLGRNAASTWAYVDYKGTRGWMSAGYLKINGSLGSMPVVSN